MRDEERGRDGMIPADAFWQRNPDHLDGPCPLGNYPRGECQTLPCSPCQTSHDHSKYILTMEPPIIGISKATFHSGFNVFGIVGVNCRFNLRQWGEYRWNEDDGEEGDDNSEYYDREEKRKTKTKRWSKWSSFSTFPRNLCPLTLIAYYINSKIDFILLMSWNGLKTAFVLASYLAAILDLTIGLPQSKVVAKRRQGWQWGCHCWQACSVTQQTSDFSPVSLPHT